MQRFAEDLRPRALALRLEIAGIPVALEGAVPALQWEAATLIGAPFTTARSPRFHLRWRAEVTAMGAEDSVVVSSTNDGQLTLEGDGFRAALDMTRRRGELAAGAVRALAPCLLAVVAEANDQLLPLHASAVARADGTVDVFSGPSGRGKSTLARSLGGALADEIVILARRPGGGFDVVGTPFWQGRPARGPLGAVYLLEHGPLLVRPAGGRAAITRLLAQTRLVMPAGLARARALALLARLFAEAPVRELQFQLGDLPDRVRAACATRSAA
jgi:hypothetical protein